MSISSIRKLAAAIGLGALVAATPVRAQTWGVASYYYHPEQPDFTRIEMGTEKTPIPMNYAFVDLSSDGYFGQAQFSQSINNTPLTAGVEAEGISGIATSIYPQVGINVPLKKGMLQFRFSPARFLGQQQQQLSFSATAPSLPLGNYSLTLSGWGDATKYQGKITALGEVEAALNLNAPAQFGLLLIWDSQAKEKLYISGKLSF